MITGRSSGSGKYTYQARSFTNRSVSVFQMPEDFYRVRIIFQHNGENCQPIKIDESEAILLWSALNGMAKELNWKDMEEK